MPRGNGSRIGVDVAPTSSAASGVWTVREAEQYARAASWPLPPPPTGPVVPSLLLHFDGADGGTTFTNTGTVPVNLSVFAGSPSTSTASSVFGGSSLSLNGGVIGDSATSIPDLSAVDFTLEGWFWRPSGSPNASILSLNNLPNGGFHWWIDSSAAIHVDNQAANQLICGEVPSNQWVHIAVVQATGTYSVYINGVLAGTQVASPLPGPYGLLMIGAWGNAPGGSGFQSSLLIDELRLAIGSAVYTANFTPPAAAFPDPPAVTVDALVVAGGGGGGNNHGGGGGAGGLLSSASLTLLTGTPYTVTVGAGGAGGMYAQAGGDGSTSTLASLSATGGGGGGQRGGSNLAGRSGGSGGGGGGTEGYGNETAGTGIVGQGHDGGLGDISIPQGGGGGGAGFAGAFGSSGAGGGGLEWHGVMYAGGGGGGGYGVPSGGAGGGGNGGGDYSPESGVANLGGGGGGGQPAWGNGASGGSGVVIIRAPQAAVSTTGSPDVTTDGGDTIYTFTGSGSITF